MLEGYGAPIKANEGRPRANPWRTDLQLERHCSIHPLLVGNASKREVDDRNALDLERGRKADLSVT